MSGNEIVQLLQKIGMSRREIDVYLFLSKHAIASTSFAAKRLKIERVQAYRLFKKMQDAGYVATTLERPTRFTAVPFEELLESYINSKKTEVESILSQKESLLSAWRANSAPESEQMTARFSFVVGKRKIFTKMLNMVEDAKKEIIILTNSRGLVQEDIAGIFDAVLVASRKPEVTSKIIADISRENLLIAEILRKKAKNLNVEGRHLDLNSQLFPCFLIKDGDEGVLYGGFGDESTMPNLEDSGLWINDKMFVSILKGFFEQMWQKAVDFENRIQFLKTGKPIGETTIIRDQREAQVKIREVLDTAKEDVIAITSSDGINKMLEDDFFKDYRKDGLRFRIMSSIDLDNLATAKRLSISYQIRHVPINYMSMIIVDKRALFMFKSPSIMTERVETPFYLDDVFYTDDLFTVERAHEMLNDIWKRGIEISELEPQPSIKLPMFDVSGEEKTSALIEMMLCNNVDSVLITENGKSVGIVTQRDILKGMTKSHKDPAEVLVKDLSYTPLVEVENLESLLSNLKRLPKERAGRIAVVKNGQLIGMLTEDLVKASRR